MVGVDNRRYQSGAYVTTDTYTYTFDRDGNQISEIQNKSGKEPISTYYTYDSLNRLIGVTESLGTSTLYQYDGAGNRIYEKYVDSNGATITNYTYDANNLLIYTDKETERGKETTRYNYDYNGNLISKMNERIEEYDIVEEPQADFGLFISGQEEDAYIEHAQEMYESTVY